MRRIILGTFIAALALPAALSAQTSEIRKDERQVDSHKEDLQRAVDSGNLRDIEKQAHKTRKAREELREDRDDFGRKHYVAPYDDWSYSTPAAGTQLRPRFYGRDYKVAHPDGYDLRHAKHGQRWIRYGNDLVLVSMRDGRVIEVVSNRF